MGKLFTKKYNQATSTIEYTMLLVIIMAAFFVTQKYIVRGFAGRWKEVGDSFGYGRQYDPKNSAECAWHADPNNAVLGSWYNPQCYDQRFDSNYNPAYNNCIDNCDAMGVCICYRLFGTLYCDWSCCHFQCKDRCTKSAETTTIGQCSSATINGTTRNCNDW